MSKDTYFSKSIKLSDIKKKCKQLKVGKQERLYGSNDAPPTYPITHKDFSNEKIYVVFNEYVDESLNAKFGSNCDDKEFCEVQCFYGDEDYHILLVLSGTFDIEYANDIRALGTRNFNRFILPPDFMKDEDDEFAPVFLKENGKLNLEKVYLPIFEEKDEIPYEGDPRPIENLFE